MAVTDQDIIDFYTQSLGRAPNQAVVDYFVNDINNNGKTMNNLASTLGAFNTDRANNGDFLAGGNYGNSVQNVIDQGKRDMQGTPGSTVNRGSFGDPGRTAIVGDGDHANQLGYTRYDGSIYWTDDPYINHTDEHTIFDANGNGVAYGYTDPITGKDVATTDYRKGTADSPYIISNNTTKTADDGTISYYHPDGTQYATRTPGGNSFYTPDSGYTNLNKPGSLQGLDAEIQDMYMKANPRWGALSPDQLSQYDAPISQGKSTIGDLGKTFDDMAANWTAPTGGGTGTPHNTPTPRPKGGPRGVPGDTAGGGGDTSGSGADTSSITAGGTTGGGSNLYNAMALQTANNMRRDAGSQGTF